MGRKNRSIDDVPVKVGDIIELTMESLGQKGDGVAKYQSFIVMVPNTELGDRKQVRIVKVLPSMAFGEVVE